VCYWALTQCCNSACPLEVSVMRDTAVQQCRHFNSFNDSQFSCPLASPLFPPGAANQSLQRRDAAWLRPLSRRHVVTLLDSSPKAKNNNKELIMHLHFVHLSCAPHNWYSSCSCTDSTVWQWDKVHCSIQSTTFVHSTTVSIITNNFIQSYNQ